MPASTSTSENDELAKIALGYGTKDYPGSAP